MKSIFVKQLIIASLAVAITSSVVETSKTTSPSPSIDHITATIDECCEWLNDDVDNVKLSFWTGKERIVIATGNLKNGGFTIDLPKTIDSKYLESVTDFKWETPVTFSNNKAKILTDYLYNSTYVLSYNKNDDFITRIGIFSVNEYGETGDYSVKHVYADSDVNISGTGKDQYGKEYIYSLILKMGWNIVYEDSTEDNKTTVTSELKASKVATLPKTIQ